MRIIAGCEESQEVCKAFRANGHEAYSCDLQDSSGGHPEWHLKMDLKVAAKLMKWDMAILFPECKHLCWSGERWFTSGHKDIKLREEAFEFFKWCLDFPADQVCVENSLSYFLERSGYPPTQKIHPFHFGSPFRKTTCIWLRKLKPLIPTNITFQRKPIVHNMWPTKDPLERSRLRAKTDPNIAGAMADQWGGKITTL
jgi:hypothetical protein